MGGGSLARAAGLAPLVTPMPPGSARPCRAEAILPGSTVEDRSEDGSTERSADGPEECHAGCSSAKVGVVDRVLHGYHQHLHGGADARAEHEHVDRSEHGTRRRAKM